MVSSTPIVNGTPPPAEPLPAVCIRFNNNDALRAVEAARRRGIGKSQVRVERDEFGTRWYVVPPAGEGEGYDGARRRHATLKTISAEPKLVPLDADQWRDLELALDGIRDDSYPPFKSEDWFGADRDPYLWAGLIPRGAVTGLFAASKAGKSTILRRLIRTAHAAGAAEASRSHDTPDDAPEVTVPLLGRGVEPFSAYVVSEEKHEDWLDEPANCRVTCYDGRPIRQNSEWKKYIEHRARIARAWEAKLLVIDSWSRVCGIDENNSRETTLAMSALRELLDYESITVLIIHHLNRSGDVRGSTALEAQCDCILRLERVNGDDFTDPRRVLTSVSRRAPASKIEYVMNAAGELVVPGAEKAPAVNGRAKRSGLRFVGERNS